MGTAEYVSPEVLNNEDATASVDLWALGCMIYQMLVGKTPFSGMNDFAMFNAIMDHSNGKQVSDLREIEILRASLLEDEK